MDFECLIPVLELIGKHSSGRTVFSLRCVSKFFNTFFSLYTPVTKKQIDTAKIIAQSDQNNIVLSSGVGSGKSLTCMMVMKEYLKKGVRSLILIDPSRFSVWTLELKKWSKVIGLPDYSILHNSINGGFGITSDIILASRMLHMDYIMRKLIENNYLCYICDEINSIPTPVYRIRSMTSKPIKCIIVNATYKGKVKGFYNISYRKDDELASKPNLDIIIFRTPSLLDSSSKMLEIMKSNLGKKTLIYMEKKIFEDGFRDAIEIHDVSNQRKKMLKMEEFQEAKSGILICDNSSLRGFNMNADTAFYVVDELRRPYLIQFLGRIHRPNHQHRNVTLIVFTEKKRREAIFTRCPDIFNEVIKCCVLYMALPPDLVLMYLDRINECRNIEDVPEAVKKVSDRARKHSLKEVPSFPKVTISVDDYTGWEICYI